jgi:hypothetical protein
MFYDEDAYAWVQVRQAAVEEPAANCGTCPQGCAAGPHDGQAASCQPPTQSRSCRRSLIISKAFVQHVDVHGVQVHQAAVESNQLQIAEHALRVVPQDLMKAMLPHANPDRVQQLQKIIQKFTQMSKGDSE